MTQPTAIVPDDAYRSGSPLVPAVRAGQFLFVSGCVPTDYRTGALAGDSFEAQAEQVLRNLQAILEASGSSLRRVVKTTVFLIDAADFPALNRVYRTAFSDWMPARSTIQVAALARPEFRVEIEAIALAGQA